MVRPQALVCLGATAAKTLLGPSFRVTRQRGEIIPSDLAPYVTATIHPSAVLRQRTDAERHAEMRRLVADLEKVGLALNGG